MTFDQLDVRVAESGLDPLFRNYLARLKRRGRGVQTAYAALLAFLPFQAWLRDNRLSAAAVTGDEMADYLAQAPYAPGTLRLHAVKLNAAYALARRGGECAVDPFDADTGAAMPSEPEPNPRDKIIPAHELRKMKLAADETRGNSRLLFYFLAYTGMRRDEVRLLQWHDLDLTTQSESATFVGKGGKRRTVPLHARLARVLHEETFEHRRVGYVFQPRDALAGKIASKPYAQGQSWARLKSVFADGIGFHHFRKTFATSLYRNGVPGDTIDMLLGWAKPSIRARYYVDVDETLLRKAVLLAYLDAPID